MRCSAVASVYTTIAQVFPNVRVFFTEKTDLTDFIFVASSVPLHLDEASSDPRMRRCASTSVASRMGRAS